MFMKTNDLPKITIAIPTFNEKENIEACLRSVFNQTYPRKLLEVIVVDDYSTDETVKIAKRFPVKLMFNGTHDGEVGKMIAFNVAKGDLFFYLDGDVELRGRNWFQKMVYPLMTNSTTVASFTRKYAKKDSTSLERYFAMEPLHRDPVYELFSPSIESTITENKGSYEICRFSLDKIPPAGRCLHRVKILKKIIKGQKRFLELDILKMLVERGYKQFAYVPSAGIYHHHVKSIGELIRKRKRNVQKVYLVENEKRLYRWFDLRSPKDLMKIIFLIFYAHSLIFSFLRGVYKSIMNKDLAGLWEPVVALVATDTIIFSFLLGNQGRKFLLSKFFYVNKVF